MENNPMVLSVSEDSYKKLKKAYEKAVKDGDGSFIFQHREILTAYAKYLLEYLNDTYKFEKK